MFRFTDPCSNLSCEHMCVSTKSGPKCLCSEEYTLAADARSCTGCFFYTFRRNVSVFFVFLCVIKECIIVANSVSSNMPRLAR